MNILQLEDMVKGAPDDQLMQEAQAPTGQVPQFLVLSELQRRTNMRKRHAAQQQEMPEGTVADQILREGIAGFAQQQVQPPQAQPPQQAPEQMPQGPQMAVGGMVPHMASGGHIPFNYSDYQYQIPTAGYPDDQAAFEAWMAKQNDSGEGTFNPDAVSTLRFDPEGMLIRDPVAEARQSVDVPSASAASMGPAAAEPRMDLPADLSKGAVAPGAEGDGWLDRIKSLVGPEKLDEPIPAGSQPFGREAWTALFQKLKWGGGDLPWNQGQAAPDDPQGIIDIAADAPTEEQLAATEAVAEDVAEEQGAPAGIETLVEGSKELSLRGRQMGPEKPQKQGFGAEVQGRSAIQQLLAQAERGAPAVPDMSDLQEKLLAQSRGAAMMQLGAGIAEDDLAAGLRGASQAMSEGNLAGLKLEADSRMIQYEAEQKQMDRDIQVYGKAAALEVAETRAAVDGMINSDRNDREVLRFVESQLKSVLDNAMILPNEGEDSVTARIRVAAELMGRWLPPHIVAKYDLTNIIMSAAGPGENPTGPASTTTTTTPTFSWDD